ncbi:class III poly(R)-hydroxyalkanoic acid synthase subunit PhaE [Lysobacteraceae bacterium NML120232]|nr:class III poly(R)-hydroxyalkanoic acid synthase subunit PhaE [Xanthomonadaceae bacterium NML08-0793]PJK10726.1 class III poly(R)-hydroxyalkanoic acid synthase subunit PhaE [Xanthomonadaceae bacterium NML120232]
MANQYNWPGDFESLARQYWAGWNEMMRQAAGTHAGFAAPQGFAMPGFSGAPFGAMPHMGGWQEMLAQWSRMAMSMGQPQPQMPGFDSTLNDTLGRFQAQAGDWYGRMQQLAAQVAGQGMSAAEIASKWKEMLESGSEGAWLEMFRAMQSPKAHGFEQWYSAVQPYLAGLNQEARGWLDLPTMGLAREHQERLQKLAQAHLDYQDKMAAYNATMMQSAQKAYENFEKKLAEHEAPGLEITSARALFDLWIDAAEDAFAQMALSSDYREVYGQMVNAQMRLRQDVQKEVENATALLGMPTRTEIEAAHRKIAELERAVRRLMRGEAAAPVMSPEVREPATPRAKAAKKTTARATRPAAQAAVSKATGKSAGKTTKKAAPRGLPAIQPPKTAASAKKAAPKTAKKTVKRSR